MAEYIKREDAFDVACAECEDGTFYDIPSKIMAIPTADVVERKHGKWIIVDKYSDYRTERCSACGFVANRTYIQDIWSFCPNCGADMRESEEEK